MGTPITDPVFGNDCIACWLANETPLYIWAMFNGVSKGNPVGSQQVPNGFIFRMEQDPGNACSFKYNWLGSGWRLQFYRNAGNAKWYLSLYFDAAEHFLDNNAGCPAEHDIWSNIYTDPNVSPGVGGVGTIWWEETLTDLITSMNVPVDSGTFYEVFLDNTNNFFYKFCNSKFHMNQVIQVS